jgi:hypothetical protein
VLELACSDKKEGIREIAAGGSYKAEMADTGKYV